MAVRTLFIGLVTLLAAASCRSSGPAVMAGGHSPDTCRPMVLLGLPPDSIRADEYQIDSVLVKEECLEIYLHYSGGCGESSVQLYFTDLMTQSMPPQTTLYLEFKDRDPCRSIVTRKLSFDLDPFRKHAETGGVIMHLGDNTLLFSKNQ